MGNESHYIEFSVWRLVPSNNQVLLTYLFIGSNIFPDATPGEDHLLSLSVSEDQQIPVQPGDIPGIRLIVRDNTSVSPFQVQAHGLTGNSTLFYALDEDEVTPPSTPVLNIRKPITPVIIIAVVGNLLYIVCKANNYFPNY